MTTPGGGPTTGEPAAPATGGGTARGRAAARERWRTFGAPALAAVTVAALCLGVLLGWLAFGAGRPGEDSAEAGFARDMSEHHAQAVQMSQLVMQRTEDEDVRRLAVDIDNNQNFERGMMAGWLAQWDLPRARPGERMDWMAGHGDGHDVTDLPAGVPMPGMASPSEIEELTRAQGREAEVLYLQLMTTHHIAGVEMAQAALDLASDEDVRAAAQRMVDAQAGEIALMTQMLAERDAEPREDVSAWLAGVPGGGAEQDGATQDADHGGDH
ncbi:DUF305 domain-containing protein [uncultured Ornithinimicrobium sp.]|uniref:DUF305 domain-containing protein n=1 Tax=uncultured Ornithinimicrobium sp. TaxID=259307 RepID=UPI00259193B7|nr:DUF305 domain-containing protein [uncultured Ornithinimicrobium sp.]